MCWLSVWAWPKVSFSAPPRTADWLRFGQEIKVYNSFTLKAPLLRLIKLLKKLLVLTWIIRRPGTKAWTFVYLVRCCHVFNGVEAFLVADKPTGYVNTIYLEQSRVITSVAVAWVVSTRVATTLRLTYGDSDSYIPIVLTSYITTCGFTRRLRCDDRRWCGNLC